MAGRVGLMRRVGSRPPHTICRVCTRNSISRMPPLPSFTLWPAMRLTGSSVLPRAVFLGDVDPALHGVDVGDGGEIQAAAPHERADRLQEAVSEREVAGDGAGLDHGGALPVLAQALVVGQRGMNGHGGRGRGRVGTQA